MRYKKISRWISVQYTRNGNPFFLFRGKRYHMADGGSMCPVILRVDAFGGSRDGYPDYIHGYSSDYMENLFVELDPAGERVRCYERVREEAAV